MKAKTRHRKSYKWRKRADSSPVAKGRRAKIHGMRNPRKAKQRAAAAFMSRLAVRQSSLTSRPGSWPGRPGRWRA